MKSQASVRKEHFLHAGKQEKKRQADEKILTLRHLEMAPLGWVFSKYIRPPTKVK